jgi:hypothetical protein
MESGGSYLMIIGEREALAWVLRESRTAFPTTRRAEVDQLKAGDELFLVTNRGCFHNPARDRTRVIGHATVASDVAPLDPPVELVGRTFPRGCDLTLNSLAPYLTGVELANYVEQLDTFPDNVHWSIRLRRPLVPMSADDASLLREALRAVAANPERTVGGYLQHIKPVAQSAVRQGGTD